MEINENNILFYLRQGEEKAYKYLFDHHYAILCHIAESFVHDVTLAEDVVCDVFCSIYEKRDSLVIRTSLKAYLVTAVKNRSLNALAASKDPFRNDLTEHIMDEHCEADNKVVLDELNGILESSIRELYPECRAVFEKSRMEGKSYSEISDDLGISVNTVKYHIKNALAHIRKDVGKYMSSIFLFMTILFD